MATEAGRHQLYEKITTEWGREHADELMSYLPPVGWADVTTKHDLDTQTALLRAETAQLGFELRGEMAQLSSGLRAEMVGLGRKIDVLGAQLRAEMHDESKSQLRWMVGILLTTQGVTIGVFAAVVNWLG